MSFTVSASQHNPFISYLALNPSKIKSGSIVRPLIVSTVTCCLKTRNDLVEHGHTTAFYA